MRKPNDLYLSFKFLEIGGALLTPYRKYITAYRAQSNPASVRILIPFYTNFSYKFVAVR